MARASWQKYLIVVLSIIILYVVYQLYETSQSCGEMPCPADLNAKFVKKYQNLTGCREGVCPFDLEEEWKDIGCSINLSDSMIYRVHITNNLDGSLGNFSCEFGPQYNPVASTNTQRLIKECNEETAEAIDSAVKGTNRTPIVYVGLLYVYPPNFNDYYYTLLACHKYNSGRLKDRYILLSFINFSGRAYT